VSSIVDLVGKMANDPSYKNTITSVMDNMITQVQNFKGSLGDIKSSSSILLDSSSFRRLGAGAIAGITVVVALMTGGFLLIMVCTLKLRKCLGCRCLNKLIMLVKMFCSFPVNFLAVIFILLSAVFVNICWVLD
jgi:hypothetical protein